MNQAAISYSFDDIVVELKTYRVLKAGRAVSIEPKAFQLLVFLVENQGRVVGKEEILDAVWKEAFVSENAITRIVAQLRKGLGDDAREARYIRTVQTRGYLFIPAVSRGETAQRPSSAETISQPQSGGIKSLAVLPLENLSGDPAQEYFADAMTDELITEIAKLGGVRLISRTSIMQYKGVRKPLPEIARELQVDAIVEGSALRASDRVRITAQLVHAATDSHLWAETYERDVSDILALQRDVGRAIAREVQGKLARQEPPSPASGRAIDPEASEAYFRGVYAFGRSRDLMPASSDLMRKSAEHFKNAIRIDPDYALAHAGLASAIRWLATYSDSALLPQAKRAATRALQLDDTIAEAHAALGWVLFKYDWDWAGAEVSYKRAIGLNPNAAYHQGYALLLSALGRHEEAIERVKLAELCDPLNLTVKAAVGLVYCCAGRLDEAGEQLQKSVEIDPELASVRWVLGWCYEQGGEHSRAIHEIEEAMRLAGSDLFGAGFLGYAYARSGHHTEAERLLERLIADGSREYISPYGPALIYAGLGKRDEALDWLEKTVEHRDGFATFLKVDARLDSVRREPRFANLLRRVGLTL